MSTNRTDRISKPPHSAALSPLRGVLSTAYHNYSVHLVSSWYPNPLKGVPDEWLEAANYWRENAQYTPRVRQATHYLLLAVGRWLAAKHPTISRPEQWDRKLAIECLAMITNMRWRAQWVGRKPRNYGKLLTPNGRILNYTALRTFFADLQEWGVIPSRFDPYRSLRPPRSVKILVPTTPRVIADDVWAKLLWAGLNITPKDFASRRNPDGRVHTYYPMEMIRADTVQWSKLISWVISFKRDSGERTGGCA